MSEMWICRLLAHSVAYAPAVRLRRAEAALTEPVIILPQVQEWTHSDRSEKKRTAGKGRGVAAFP
ncbi:hypothetical protein DP473_24185 [Salmonella enterica]|nr:hypothetical protein [Salmonella enterica]EAS9367865.1 hypothetical protein [Salmonella enterica]EBJ1927743.1 hypothetical protein [Salmonella enterica]EBS0088152.1 hypothetical protein [Salmonella enterica subsp. enterica serovar Muenster]ECB0869637.1 hypothetical protein [Salmonella enterica subsp. enterica serovar Muenster]